MKNISIFELYNLFIDTLNRCKLELIQMDDDTIEYELSASINIWEPLLYNNKRDITLDVYYCKNGFPKDIHDNYGANAIVDFRINLIKKIKQKNRCNDIWRISSDAFAILYNKKNCGNFTIKHKEIKLEILKKTIHVGCL